MKIDLILSCTARNINDVEVLHAADVLSQHCSSLEYENWKAGENSVYFMYTKIKHFAIYTY